MENPKSSQAAPTSDESIGVGGERLAEGGTRGVRFCLESSEQDQKPIDLLSIY